MKELIKEISKKSHIKEETIKEVIETMKEVIEEKVMKEKKKVQIRGLGTLKLVERKIAGKKVRHISFVTSRRLKQWYSNEI